MGNNTGDIILGFVILVAGIALYVLPSIIAGYRHKKNVNAIGVLNLLLGWTVIGWIVALIWALTED